MKCSWPRGGHSATGGKRSGCCLHVTPAARLIHRAEANGGSQAATIDRARSPWLLVVCVVVRACFASSRARGSGMLGQLLRDSKLRNVYRRHQPYGPPFRQKGEGLKQRGVWQIDFQTGQAYYACIHGASRRR